MPEKPSYEELEQGINDAGERLQADEELRESEERYRTILESIEEAYFEVFGQICTTGNILASISS